MATIEAIPINDEEILPLDQQENEDDLEGVQPSEAVLFNTDWTVETLFRQVHKGNINLDPQFQRREAWDVNRKSKLVESILCNFPIPNIVLAEEKNRKGRYIVIDGKQRLFSITSFLNDEYVLQNLSIRRDLNGKKFSDLNEHYVEEVNVIENQPIRTVIIRNWPDENYLYSVFYRLNSGSLPLSSQELRKALHGGKLLDYIDDFLRASGPHKMVFGAGVDRRMRDVELVLRFVAFERFLKNYDGNLKRFLDDRVVYYNDNWDSEKSNLDADLEKYNIALTIASKVFGEKAFKKWNGSTFERRINRAVFDVIARYFVDPAIEQSAIDNKDQIIVRFKELCESNLAFREAIERTTKTPTATRTRYKLWGEQLANILGKHLDHDNMRLV